MSRQSLRTASVFSAACALLSAFTANAAPDSIRHERIRIEAPFDMPVIETPVFPARDFVITDYGAKEKSDVSTALRAAIAACHEAGGGRVVIPPGSWETGPVHFKSKVDLHLETGARLLFSDDPKDYLPAVRSSFEGWECMNYSPLIYAYECTDVAITGKGVLEAKLNGWKSWMGRPPAHLQALKDLYTMGSTGVPVDQRRMAEGENNLRPPFIQFNRCKNILIEDVTIRNSPFWTIHLLLDEHVVVRRVDISATGHNNDGIDPECSRKVLIEDCRFNQGDDAIAIKSGTNHDGWRLDTPSENIVIRRCTVTQAQQLVAIGSELSGGVRNVYVHDCVIDTRQAEWDLFNILFIKTNRRRGGFVENIVMENIDATHSRYRMGVLGIETDVLYQWRKLVTAYEERLTPIRGVTVRNVKAGETRTAFKILGDPDLPVRDVRIDAVSVERVRGQRNRYENAVDVRETGVTIGTFFEEPDQENKNK